MMDGLEDNEDVLERVAALERSLEAVQTELRDATNRDIPLLKGTLRAIMATEIDTIDEFPAAGRAFGQRLVQQEERLAETEAQMEVVSEHSAKSTKAEKIAAVLSFARNKADKNGKVAVTPTEIRGCTGVSRRYAYDLVDAMAAEVDGVSVRASHRVQTGTGSKRKQKALLVDCDQVHGLKDTVNEFTTGGGAENGQ